jgi:long-chain acyl-CoA synthetase
MRTILESTTQFGSRPFLIYGDEVIDYRQHYERVAALAHHLTNAGVGKGDRIAIGMRNYPEWVISFWACQAIGAIAVAINAWWTGPEISFALQDSSPAALLIDGERLQRLSQFLDRANPKAVVVTRAVDAPGYADAFEDVVANPASALPAVEIGADELATILYTSGTTGRPKGAMATHRNHITNLMNSLLAGAVAQAMLGDSAPSPEDLPQPAMLQTFPFFHIGGLTGLYLGTATGAKIAMMYKWNPAEAVDLIIRHKLSSFSGVPIVVRQLLEATRYSGVDLSTVLGVAAGGASVPPDLIRRIAEQFESKAVPANGYGLTETTSAVITNSGAEYFEHPDSIGKPVPTADVRIVDEAGNDLDTGQIGELWISGPNVIPGYWRNPQATEAAFGGGWFRTGDLGYRDEDGFHYIVDRKKDVIIRGGENVYCAEVEAEILEHPLVKDVAVVGIPDPEYGEQVAALIQVARLGDAAELPVDLRTKLSEKLARFKIPTRIRLTEDDLPRTATGKVLKRELREMLSREDS